MKKITFLLILFSLSFTFAQVQIGSGTDQNQSTPFEPYYGFSYAQSIYTAAELVTSGTITAIQWYYSGTTALPNSQDLSVYIGHTTKTEFTSTTDWEPIGNLTLSYTGGITIPTPGTNGWVTITLDTPFVYNGTSNLIVAVDENIKFFLGINY